VLDRSAPARLSSTYRRQNGSPIKRVRQDRPAWRLPDELLLLPQDV